MTVDTPTIAETVQRVAADVRARAYRAEQDARIADATIADLESAGIFRLLQPTRFGGAAVDPVTFFDAERELSKACGSTGWATGVVCVGAWILGLCEPSAQDDVWGDDPNARICLTIAPVGQVTVVDGGYQLSGRFSFASGCELADWAFLGAMVIDESGAKPPDMRLFLVPKTNYTIDPVWNAVGLRATASHDIVVDNAFVPAAHTIGMADMWAPVRPGQAVNPEPIFGMPLGPIFTTTISTAMIGSAQAAYDAYLKASSERIRAANRSKVAEDPHSQVRLGRASSAIDGAWLQLMRNVDEIYRCVERGEQAPMEFRTRTRRDQVLASERAMAAADLLMENAGGNAMRTGDNPLQRAWRDIHTGRGHVTNDPERALVLFGAAALGQPVFDPML